MSEVAQEQLISTPAQFRNVQVFLGARNGLPVLRVTFWNMEFYTWQSRLIAFCAIFTIGGCIPLALWLSHLARNFGISGWWGAGAALALLLLNLAFFHKEFEVPRTIVLDMADNRLRVYRRKRLMVEAELSRLAKLTVEDNPDAELARAARAKGMRPNHTRYVEKEHCLFGWFGHRGSERVLLLKRAEWPSLYSLAEVREAVLWAKAAGEEVAAQVRAGNAALDGELAVADGDDDDIPVLRMPPPAGIKPPLD